MKKEKNFKAIVWDLDNTIWDGVLLENDRLVLRNNIRNIITELDQRGILHCICSKNNHDDAISKLESYGLKEYFLFPHINWDLKSENIRKIREKLNIGMDTIAFIDDQPFERDEVCFVHPEISCFDVDIIENILEMPEFKPRFITEESAQRRLMYISDEKRNEEETTVGNNKQFLEGLDLNFIIAPATVNDLQRVEELTVRTNQLNATGYTYSYEELEAFLTSPNHKLFVAELTDKYGSYGKIGVTLLECNEEVWTVKLLLMSCRVMSRGVGTVLLNYMMNLAKESNKKLHAEFLPTDRNRLMNVTYKFAGFKEIGKLENGGQLLEHPLTDFMAYPEYIKMEIVKEIEIA